MYKDIFNSWLVERNIAHRGLHTDEFPENSLPAFQNAIKHGTPIELDVQQIADGTLIVFHDNSLQRLTGKDGYVKNLTKEVLKNHFLNKTEYSIPTLQEVLDCVNGQVPILFELKNRNKVGSLEKDFWNTIKNYKGDYAIESFNPFTLEWFKKNAPNVLRGQIASYFKNEKNMSFFRKLLLRRMSFNKKISEPNFISYNAKDLPNRFVKKFKELPLLAWTIKTQEEYLNILPYCDNIIFENFDPRL